MIVIKTANGCRFINEAEVNSVVHKKDHAFVLATFKDGTRLSANQVEDIYYTNKTDKEIHDTGLVLAGAWADAEYYRGMNKYAEKFAQDLIHWRNELECFILDYIGKPDEPYAVRFVENLKKKREERPNNQREELEEYRSYQWCMELRKESHQKGEEAEKAFTELTAKIQHLEDMNKRYQDASERIMKRNIWQRIINKKTFL